MVDFCFQYRLMTRLKTKTLQYSFDENLKKDTKTSKSCLFLSFTFSSLPYVLEQVNVEKTGISASIASSFQQRPKCPLCIFRLIQSLQSFLLYLQPFFQCYWSFVFTYMGTQGNFWREQGSPLGDFPIHIFNNFSRFLTWYLWTSKQYQKNIHFKNPTWQ